MQTDGSKYLIRKAIESTLGVRPSEFSNMVLDMIGIVWSMALHKSLSGKKTVWDIDRIP
jgi:hypothetical protein